MVKNNMTDPVTNVEIEDVLSSIRRLVSENTRTAAPGRNASQAPEPVSEEVPQARPVEDNMLVLTPALRVAESDGEHPETADDEVQADLEHAIHDTFLEALDEAAEEAAQDAFEEIADVDDDQDDALTSMNEPTEPEDEPVSADAGESLEGRIAELEAAVAARQDQWEPDGVGDDDYAGVQVDAMTWEDHDEIGTDRDWLDAEDAEVIQPEPEPEFEPEPESEPEVASAHDDTNQAVDSDWAEPDDSDEISVEDAWDEAKEPESDVDLMADDSILDEEALREMVAEIVRQELQGSLGERITRNVRKLVRREIHRALAAQELD